MKPQIIKLFLSYDIFLVVPERLQIDVGGIRELGGRNVTLYGIRQ
jgi:hypothetical protein